MVGELEFQWDERLGPVVGIDFGSRNARVGLTMDRKHMEIMKDELLVRQSQTTSKIVRQLLPQNSSTTPGIWLVSAFMAHLRSLAEAYFNQTITSAVITVPAYILDSEAHHNTLQDIYTHSSPYASPKPFISPNQNPLKILHIFATPNVSFSSDLYDISSETHILTINVGASLEVSTIRLES
ncbi:hypothetical protein WG66_013414 [Moniliophthora roreri]|nr:hypothetical protein WG66_013414 [Moniliophthora roreri]